MKQKILLLSLLAVPGFAFAEENVFMLPNITVEAQSKQTDPSQKFNNHASLGALGNKKVIDTPFSIRTYNEKAIADHQADYLMDVMKNDPSVRATTNIGHLNENLAIRGFTVNWEDYNLNGSYGMAPSGRIPTDILGSVTVLKGPNALVAGQAPNGSVGGVVIANTKRAEQDLTQVSASYEDGGYYKSGFDLARRFGDNQQFGARLSGSYGQGEHVIDDMQDQNNTAVLALDYTTDQFKVNLDAYAVRDKRQDGSPAMISFATLGKVLDAPDGKSNFFPKIEGKQHSEYVGLSGEYNILEQLKLSAGIGFASREYKGHLFGTRMVVRDLPANSQGMTNAPLVGANGDALAQYYRVGSDEQNTAANLGIEGQFNTGVLSHTVGLRADYLNREWTQHQGRGATEVYFPTNIYNPSHEGHMPYDAPKIIPTGDNDYISYTLTDQISIADDKVQVILGARYQDMDIRNLAANPNTKYSENKISPSFAINIKPFDADLALYASYVEGLAQGSTVSVATDKNYGKTFAPFQTKQYELGAKYQNKNWLHTLALYQIEKPSTLTDSTYRDSADPSITQITTDDAETSSQGIEYAVSGKLNQNLALFANLAYLDAKYDKTALKTTTGNVVEGTPEFTAGLGVEYSLPTVEGLALNARVSYVDEQYLDSANTLELPNYTLLDLGAKYATQIGGINTTFRANIDNVTNEKYWAGVFNSGFTTLGDARKYKLGVTFDF